MPVILADMSTAYTTAGAIVTRVSQLGVDLRTDDGPDVPDDAVDQVIEQASGDIDFYCGGSYSDAQLLTSRWVTSKALDIAVYYLCCRRLETPPASVTKLFDEATKKLEQVRTGAAVIPGIARSRSFAPTLSQPNIDMTRYPSSRVEKPRSVGEAAGYRRDIDDAAGGAVR